MQQVSNFRAAIFFFLSVQLHFHVKDFIKKAETLIQLTHPWSHSENVEWPDVCFILFIHGEMCNGVFCCVFLDCSFILWSCERCIGQFNLAHLSIWKVSGGNSGLWIVDNLVIQKYLLLLMCWIFSLYVIEPSMTGLPQYACEDIWPLRLKIKKLPNWLVIGDWT
jgi:hypothetical protein